MNDEQKIDPGHQEVRGLLRVAGPSVAAVGLVFLVVGVGNFLWMFTNVGGANFGFPRYFWCAFVGIPLLAFGTAMTQAAYAGKIFRYMSGEAAPVQKDTFNYLAEGTSEGIGHIARAVGQGFASGASGQTQGRDVECPRCSRTNPLDANFCSQCGTALIKTCSGCGAPGEPEDRFCKQCGHSLV